MVSWRINSTKFSNNIKLNRMNESNKQAENKPCTIHDVELNPAKRDSFFCAMLLFVCNLFHYICPSFHYSRSSLKETHTLVIQRFISSQNYKTVVNPIGYFLDVVQPGILAGSCRPLIFLYIVRSFIRKERCTHEEWDMDNQIITVKCS